MNTRIKTKINKYFDNIIYDNSHLLDKDSKSIFIHTFKLFKEFIDSNAKLKNFVSNDKFLYCPYPWKDDNSPIHENFFITPEHNNFLNPSKCNEFFLTAAYLKEYEILKNCETYKKLMILFIVSMNKIDKRLMPIKELFFFLKKNGFDYGSELYKHIKNNIFNMKITAWIISDIHLEKDSSFQITTEHNFDILICAGDIEGRNVKETFKYLRNMAKDKPVILVMGNHDYASKQDLIPFNRSKIIDDFQTYAKEYDVYLLEKQSINLEINGWPINIIGTTLWTDWIIPLSTKNIDYENNYPFIVKKRIMSIKEAEDNKYGAVDFYLTKVSDNTNWSVSDHISEHVRSLLFLENELVKNDSIFKIVVTHHAPSLISMGEKYITGKYFPSWEPAFYASSLDQMITEIGPDVWVHGHIHERNDYSIGKTRIISNAIGNILSKKAQYFIDL